MIVCHGHEFVFLKTRKTASTSIEIALSRFCEPHDVVTRIADEDEEIRRQEGGFGPYNHLKPLWRYTPHQLWKWVKHRRVSTRFRNHADASVATTLVPADFWNRAFKFTAERNPWSKAVSRYYWQKRRWEYRPRTHAFPGFEDYLAWLEENKPHWLSCWSIYTIGNSVAVDDFMFYEDLEASLHRVSKRIGSIRLPQRRAKQRQQPASPDYRPEFSDRACEIVARVCHNEIATFGYRFGDPWYKPQPLAPDTGPDNREVRRQAASVD